LNIIDPAINLAIDLPSEEASVFCPDCKQGLSTSWWMQTESAQVFKRSE